MAKNRLVENIKTSDVFEFVDFYDLTYRYNMIAFKELLKKTGKKRLEDFNSYDEPYASKIALVTRTFQNFIVPEDNADFKYCSAILESYAQELILDLIEDLTIKPELIVTNFNVCPQTKNLHIHALLVFKVKVRKAELVKCGPSLGYQMFGLDYSSIRNAVKHCKKNEHETTLFTQVKIKENEYLNNYVDDVYYVDLIPRIKEIIG